MKITINIPDKVLETCKKDEYFQMRVDFRASDNTIKSITIDDGYELTKTDFTVVEQSCVYSRSDREETDYVNKFLYKRKINAESDMESKDYERVIDYITKIEDKYVLGVELNVKLVELIEDLKNKFNK